MSAAPEEVTIAPEPFDAPAAELLRAEQRAEIDGRYGEDTEPGAKPTSADTLVFLIARDPTGAPLGCGGLRRVDAQTAELKRMYVRPQARGRGLARRLLAALEAAAAEHGATRVVLETGPLQHEAIALYESAGYRPIPAFGPYVGAPLSRCYGRELA